MRNVNDERGVVYRWMLRELHLEHFLGHEDEEGKDLDDALKAARASLSSVIKKKQDRPILCDNDDID